MLEQRGRRRQRVCLEAMLTGADDLTIGQKVRVYNVSHSGAQLVLQHPDIGAGELRLVMSRSGLAVAVAVVWRRGDRVGVAFPGTSAGAVALTPGPSDAAEEEAARFVARSLRAISAAVRVRRDARPSSS